MDDLFKLNKELWDLDFKDTVALFNELLCLEAMRLGIPLSKIDCPQGDNVTIKDGGIDASVSNSTESFGDLIVDKVVKYQLKADSNKPWNEATIIKELFNLSKTEFNKLETEEEYKNKLKPSVKNCFDKNCTYVYVSFKHTFLDNNKTKTINNIISCVEKCGYKSPKIMVIGYEQLNNIIEHHHPVLLLNLKNIYSDISYKTISNNSDLRNQYFYDNNREHIIQSIQKNLLNHKMHTKAVHIRVLGQSGIGKTKTVIEALKPDQLKANCVYFESPEKFDNSGFINNKNSNASGIIVIDECDLYNCERLYNKIVYAFTNIKLITIYNANSKDTIRVDDDKCFVVDKLSNEKLYDLIIQSYPTIPERTVQKIIQLCEGFPRVALIVAQNVHNNPEQYLENMDNIWMKYISNNKDINAQETKDCLKILKIMSLFSKIGYSGKYGNEFQFIKEKIKSLYSIADGDIDDCVSNLVNRNILRGNSTLYICPRIFQNWLKAQHWKSNKGFEYEKFKEKMSESLLQNFNHELIEISDDIRQSILLSQFIENSDILKKNELFEVLAYEQNELAFSKLEKMLSELPDSDFPNLDSRYQYLLRHYAKNPEYFERSCNLLLKIACYEGEKWYSNKADSCFAELFTIFYESQMATTFTDLSEKYKYLNALYENVKLDESKILVIIKAIKDALQDPMHYHQIESYEMNSFTRLHLTKPFNYTEKEITYLDNIFNLVFKIIEESSNTNVLDACAEIFKSVILYMLCDDDLIDLAYEKYIDFMNLKKYDPVVFIKTFNFSIRQNWYKNITKDNLKKVKKLYKIIQSSNNYDKFRIFCITHYSEYGDEIEFNDLMSKTTFDDDTFRFLLSKESNLSFSVGRELALTDNNLSILLKILSIYKTLDNIENKDLIWGYFRGFNERDNLEFEKFIYNIKEEDELFKILPDIINDNPSDDIVKYLFGFIKKGIFPINVLNSRIYTCSKELLESVVKYILDKESENKNAILLSLDIINYNIKNFIFDTKIVQKVLILSANMVFGNNTHYGYVWHQILTSYINKNTHINIICKIYIELLDLAENLDSHLKDSLVYLASLKPKYISKKTFEYINQQDKNKLFSCNALTRYFWLNNGLFYVFGKDDIIKWIDEDSDLNLEIVAPWAPDHFLPDPDDVECGFYRELLIKYPNSKRLRTLLSCQSSTGSWIGKRSTLLEQKIEKTNNLIAKEKEAAVLAWLKNELSYAKTDLQRTIENEERYPY